LELLFETFGCNAAYLARNATLAAFAAGRASALVVDCGAGTTSVSPVVDGYVLTKGIRTSRRGGDHVDAHAYELLTKLCGGTAPLPLAAVRREGKKTYDAWPDQFRTFCARECVRDLKESYGVIPKKWGLAVGLKKDRKQFHLPDGTVVDVTTDIVRAPEQLFEEVVRGEVEPEKVEAPTVKVVRDARVGNRALQPPQITPLIADPLIATLPEMVKGSLERVDVDVRKDLLLNIVLTGGGSCAPGTAERLHSDVALSLCAPFKAKVISPSEFERKFGVWIGGSILSSLGSFQQMWLSRKEYEDDGPTRLVEGRWD
jgi:actin-related protein